MSRRDHVRAELDALKEAVPMAELAARRGLALASNTLIRCPHCGAHAAELSTDENGYSCRRSLGGCGRDGDQIAALEVLERTDFPGAVRALEEMAAQIAFEESGRHAGQGRLL